MNEFEFLNWITDFYPDFYIFDNFIFIDRNKEGSDFISREIGNYENVKNAAYWINIVLIGDFLDKILSDTWRENEIFKEKILLLYEEIFRSRIKMCSRDLLYSFSHIDDPKTGDFGITIAQ
jgi:hypothetical protein